MMLLQRAILGASLLLAPALAFSARKGSELVRSAASSPTSSSSSPLSRSALSVGAVWTEDEDYYGDDSFLLGRAGACADSESCSLEEARACLDGVLRSQADCVGDALGSSPLCGNADKVAEVVAGLRQKIAREERRLAPLRAAFHLANLSVGAWVMWTVLHGVAAVPNVPVDGLSMVGTLPEGQAPETWGVATILPQEWYWSVRDGYFPSLLAEWAKHGGLSVDLSAFDEKVVPFSPQEWVWAAQNGSLGTMLGEHLRYGGYLVDSGYDTEGLSPLTPQEWAWSVRGGYFGDALRHFYRNGGI